MIIRIELMTQLQNIKIKKMKNKNVQKNHYPKK